MRSLSSSVRWLAPSVIAACAGAIAAGLVEGHAARDMIALGGAAGLTAIVAIPVLLSAAVSVRGLVAAWKPRELAAALTEDGDAMPRLAGWVATVWLGALVLAWAVFQSTWVLSWWTAFKPLAVGLALPIVAVGTVLGVGALSRPAAHLLAAIARAIDRRWQRRGHRTLLRPRAIFGGALVSGTIVVYALWRIVVRPRLGGFDVTTLHAPIVAIIVAALVHVAWQRLGRGRIVLAIVAGGLALVALVLAFVTVSTRPAETLSIWGTRPIAGLAVEHVFDLDEIRDRVPRSEHALPIVPGAPRPDIVLITLDTVRADHTPPYGGPAEMPVLAALAERGTVFEYAFAPSNTTERSIPSMLTGTAANRVRPRGDVRLDPRHVVLAERLRAGGYDTAAFVCCPQLYGAEARTGLARGFDHLVVDHEGVKLAYAAHDWIAKRARTGTTTPLFVWIHLREPAHWAPAMLPSEPAERLALYHRALRITDSYLADVVSATARRAPIVIVTSDHGEALGDHDDLGHGTDLYNTQVRVPLVIAGPGIATRRIRETVGLVDLVPTVLELAGFAVRFQRSFDGHSLASLARGEGVTEASRGVAFMTMPGLAAVVQHRWKLIQRGVNVELYDLYADPAEVSNHVTVRPELVISLKKLLDQHRQRARDLPF